MPKIPILVIQNLKIGIRKIRWLTEIKLYSSVDEIYMSNTLDRSKYVSKYGWVWH